MASAQSQKKELKEFSRDEVEKHSKSGDMWIIIDAKVYDVSKFMDLVSARRCVEVLMHAATAFLLMLTLGCGVLFFPSSTPVAHRSSTTKKLLAKNAQRCSCEWRREAKSRRKKRYAHCASIGTPVELTLVSSPPFYQRAPPT